MLYIQSIVAVYPRDECVYLQIEHEGAIIIQQSQDQYDS